MGNINNKFITSQFLLNHVPTNSKRERRIIVYGLLTRYGPQTSCHRKGLKFASYRSICARAPYHAYVSTYTARDSPFEGWIRVLSRLKIESVSSFCRLDVIDRLSLRIFHRISKKLFQMQN